MNYSFTMFTRSLKIAVNIAEEEYSAARSLGCCPDPKRVQAIMLEAKEKSRS